MTDENDFAAFEQSLSAGPEPVTETAKKTDKPVEALPDQTDMANAEADTANDGAAEDQQPKQNKTSAKDRISQLTWEKHEAARIAEATKAEAEAIRAENAALVARLEAIEQGKTQQQPVNNDGAPNPANYEFGEDDALFHQDLGAFYAKQQLRAEALQREAEQAQKALSSAFETFEQKARELFPDGPSPGLTQIFTHPRVSQSMAELICASEIGPQLADEIGSKAGEIDRLAALPAHQLGRAIGIIEGRLLAATSQASPPPPSRSKAPNPPEAMVRGSSGRFAVAPETDDFAAFEKQYL